LTVYVIEDSPYVCSCALYTNGGIEKEAVWWCLPRTYCLSVLHVFVVIAACSSTQRTHRLMHNKHSVIAWRVRFYLWTTVDAGSLLHEAWILLSSIMIIKIWYKL
jgi:hypothetical protein